MTQYKINIYLHSVSSTDKLRHYLSTLINFVIQDEFSDILQTSSSIMRNKYHATCVLLWRGIECMRKNFWIKFRSWVLWSVLVLIWHVQGGGRGSINRRRHCRCLRSTPRVKFHWSVNPRRDTPGWYGHRIVPHLLIPIFGPIQQIPTAMFSKISFVQYWVLFSIYHKNEIKGLLVVIYKKTTYFTPRLWFWQVNRLPYLLSQSHGQSISCLYIILPEVFSGANRPYFAF